MDGRNRWISVLADSSAVVDDRAVQPALEARLIAIVAYPGVQSLDVTGPLEVFAGAQRLIDASSRSERGYDVRVLSRDGQPLQTSSGLGLIPHGKLSSQPAPIDTVIVAGGSGHVQACEDRPLLDR